MDPGYDVYCFTDPLFYDTPLRWRDDDVDFEPGRRARPPGWERAELEDCLAFTPTDARVPQQGWKIHVSACLEEAEQVLAVAYGHCIARRVAFKFVRSRQLLLLANAKYADRASSGKFVTIYPADENELERLVSELGSALAGHAGPYVLNDLRVGDGPLYVRYGGFAERWCIGPGGEQVLAIEDATGRLVPDRRAPTFQPPPWVDIPAFLSPHLQARNGATVEDLPYRIEEALHFSNGGGIYAASDRAGGARVVLKEARPHAGLATDGSDAVTRLDHERRILERLGGLEVVPAVRGSFELGGHRFLALDHVEGDALSDLLVERYPLAYEDVDAAAVRAFTAWVLDLQARVEDAVAQVHARGVVVGDVHPHNVLVRPDGGVVLIDFEVASDVSEQRRPTLGDPAFVAPPDCAGVDVDLYALACLRLFMFLPLTALIGIEAAKADELAGDIATVFPVPAEHLGSAVSCIRRSWAPARADRGPASPRTLPRRHLDEGRWRDASGSMASAILASATPERDDRLFPGDPKQFSTGGLDLAHGAAGVLYALDVTGNGRHDELESWLVRRALEPGTGTRLGFYDGLHGVAHALARLGRVGEALEVLDICTRELRGRRQHLGLDLHSGLAGIGLNLVHFAVLTGDRSLHDEVAQVTQLVADRLGGVEDVATVSGGEHPYAGLLRGSSGPALLFLHRFDGTGDDAYLDLARTALHQDLRRCLLDEDGSLGVDEGWRTMPYLAEGSVGIGMVLDRYLARRADEQLATFAGPIRRAAEAQLYVQSGLFYGRAGMILHLSATRSEAEHGDALAGQVRRLAWHAIGYRGHLAFPGEELLRLSMDLATGTAGVMLAVGAALGDERAGLPFLGSAGRPGAGLVDDRTATMGRG